MLRAIYELGLALGKTAHEIMQMEYKEFVTWGALFELKRTEATYGR